LACEGTVIAEGDEAKENAKPEPVSKGIIVDFKNRIVRGFGSNAYDPSGDYPVRIIGMNETTVTFSGFRAKGSVEHRTDGTMDRVTGAVDVSESSTTESGKVIWSFAYLLKCRPAQRMF